MRQSESGLGDTPQDAYGPSWFQRLAEPVDNLRLLGRRSILALLGIAVGCMAVVALLNIGHNAGVQAMSVFKNMGSDLMVASVLPPEGAEQGQTHNIAVLDTEKLHRMMPGLSAIAPVVPVNMETRMGKYILSAPILGSNDELASVLDLHLSAGRFLSPYDAHSTHAVIGASVISTWTRAGIHVVPGDHVQIGGYVFEIIGMLLPRGKNALIPISPDDAIILPGAGMRRIIPEPGISVVLARYSGSGIAGTQASRLRYWLSEQLQGFRIDVQIPRELLDGMAQQSRLFSWLLAGLGAIALLVGGTGVMNVMVMNVSARRREIGVRMALGARPRDIALLFLLESVVLATAGAIVGSLSGLMLSWIFVYYSGWTSFSLSAISLPLGISSAMATGLFFGLSPAMAAARLSPVQALRDE